MPPLKIQHNQGERSFRSPRIDKDFDRMKTVADGNDVVAFAENVAEEFPHNIIIVHHQYAILPVDHPNPPHRLNTVEDAGEDTRTKCKTNEMLPYILRLVKT